MSSTKPKAEVGAEEAQDGILSATEDAGKVVMPKKKKRKWPIILGVFAVVFVAAGAGFWVWHEQPSFCGAICHQPMDPYLVTFEGESGKPGTDKWGNEVKDAHSMMVVSHKEHEVECMGCHVPTLSEQLQEGQVWITGNYEVPLEERKLKDLVEARGIKPDEFCLNDACHHVSSVDGSEIKTRDDLKKATSKEERNPHQPQHGDVTCSDCHKAHRESVNYCSGCHNDSPIPDGWISVAEQKAKMKKK